MKRPLWAPTSVAAGCLLLSADALAAGSGVLTGTVIDTQTRLPAADVVVTATSPTLQQEQMVVTDSAGQFRIPDLPPGTYTLRLDKEAYRPSSRTGIELRLNTTIRVNSELMPETLQAKEIVVTAAAPTVDVGSSAAGVHVDAEFVRRMPVVPTTAKGAGSRSFESLAEVAPGVQADRYGASFNGTTSPENQYVIDGVSVNSPALAVLSTPLAVDFVREVNVISGGYLPEYGRASGGQLDVLTKSGSNDFHGAVFFSTTPGALAASPRQVKREGTTISTVTSLSSIQSYGAELGGPVIKDKLWFYVGVVPTFTRYRLDRDLRIVRRVNGAPVVDENGFTQTDVLPGTEEVYYATGRNVSYLGKLTLRIDPDNRVELSVFGAPSWSGGDGTFGITPADGAVELNSATSNGNIDGTHDALAHQYMASATDIGSRWSTAFRNKTLLVDTTLGWHHEENGVRGADGSKIGSGEGLSAIPTVRWQKLDPGPRSINDFEPSAATAACDPAGTDSAALCPVRLYTTGGAGLLNEATLDRVQGKSALTALFSAAGKHLVKVGVDLEMTRYENRRGVSGSVFYIEDQSGQVLIDGIRLGFLDGPDDARTAPYQDATSKTYTLGGFVQDSWSVGDHITLNAGVRYDVELLYGSDDRLAMSLPNQWSPRVGVLYDPTQAGRSKLYASYARFYQSVPLDIVDRTLPGRPAILSLHLTGGCDLRSDPRACDTEQNRLPIGAPWDPNARWIQLGTGRAPIDPDIEPPSADEIMIGGEYEVAPKVVVGARYIKRWQNRVIEDLSPDDGRTYFIGNPGYGIAAGVPKAVRDYDALTLHAQKSFSDGWLVQGNYTISYLRGNWSGLFRPENGQLNPNLTSDFDLVSLLPNLEGPLPGDRTHQLKLFAAKDIVFKSGVLLNLGASYRGRSGAPTSYLGAHPTYGLDQVYILQRGSGDRLPWVHDVDMHVGIGLALAEASDLIFSIDAFNILNLQAATAVDQRYTQASVRPILGGTTDELGKLVNADGTPFDPALRNPNFGNPTAYQAPRSFRLNAKVTF